MDNNPALKVWLDRDGALLRLRLNRPKPNVVDAHMMGALRSALAEYRGRPGLLAALLDAEGPHFSFGASVQEHLPTTCAQMLAGMHAMIIEMLEWPAPILAAVQGQCLGGGLELAMACSQIFVADDAKLGQPEIQLGVFAPAASCLMPARVGQGVAEDLLLSGRSIDAAQAVHIGLANSVSADPGAAALAYFDKYLATRSSVALACAVAAARGGYVNEVRRRLAEVERIYNEQTIKTRDALEGLNAFMEKRPPTWQHR
jgi:cyclohexa-1,5-dienecarbonyl-CoA hydratase